MSANQAAFPIATMARVLGVSKAGYYAWAGRQPSARTVADAALLKRIRTIHLGSRETYGAPRIHADLREQGARHSRKRIARLMREAGLVGASHRRGNPITTRRNKEARPAPDLVDRNFVATDPNRLWVADITYVPTAAGFLYLAVVLDAFSRRVVGWAMADHLRTELVLEALGMALWQRRPAPGVVFHSDHGCQYTSLAFGRELRQSGLVPSMGSVADAYDNAVAESFFATLECELLDRRSWPTKRELSSAVFDFIEGFYNPRRRHSTLGYLSPADYEQQHKAGRPHRDRRMMPVTTPAPSGQTGPLHAVVVVIAAPPGSQKPVSRRRSHHRPGGASRDGDRPGAAPGVGFRCLGSMGP